MAPSVLRRCESIIKVEMNYYKPMHQQSPEHILHRSNQLFLRIIALYVLIAACGFGIDIKFYHAADDRIYYLVENKIENDESITADLRYYGRTSALSRSAEAVPSQ